MWKQSKGAGRSREESEDAWGAAESEGVAVARNARPRGHRSTFSTSAPTHLQQRFLSELVAIHDDSRVQALQ